jgi:hypothetical protein
VAGGPSLHFGVTACPTSSESQTRLGIVLLRDCAIPELLRVKHRIDARTDPEKARHETVAWIKRLGDMRRVAETSARAVFLPPSPHDFVGRTEALASKPLSPVVSTSALLSVAPA